MAVEQIPGRARKARDWRSVLGPGLIAGASDDDPSGIATYSQAGAQLGFAISWTMLFSYPLMVAIQEISAPCGLQPPHTPIDRAPWGWLGLASAANPKFAPQLPRVRLRTSGSKRH